MKPRTLLLITVSCMISFAPQQLMAQEKTKKKATMTKTETAKEPHLKIHTSYGDMVIKLYNETPLHRDNFLKLAQEKFFDSLLFHRVIKGFMIQGGDPLSKNANPTQMLGSGDNGYTIPAEFNSNLIHKKGALAAARTENPKKESSGCQFYIVHGKPMTDAELNMMEQRNGIKYTEAQRNAYKTVGGTPFLDMNYTVFGEVISGLDVIDKIAGVQTQPGDRPAQDVRMTVTVVK
jgi:cyclophilin family peptidyl-prolyl cis-trans isomerase